MRNLSNDLIYLAVSAARAGTYPTDGRFYYVAYVYVNDDGMSVEDIIDGGWMPEYLQLDQAIGRSNDWQAMADAVHSDRHYVVKTREDGRIVYRSQRAKRGAVWSHYPADWPACACGLPVMDGRVTCGHVQCGTAAEVERMQRR